MLMTSTSDIGLLEHLTHFRDTSFPAGNRASGLLLDLEGSWQETFAIPFSQMAQADVPTRGTAA